MACVGLISGQEVKILFRGPKTGVALGVDLVNPKFLACVIVVVDLEEDLVHKCAQYVPWRIHCIGEDQESEAHQ